MLVGVAYICSEIVHRTRFPLLFWGEDDTNHQRGIRLFTSRLSTATRSFGLLPIAQELPSLGCCFQGRASQRMQVHGVAQLFLTNPTAIRAVASLTFQHHDEPRTRLDEQREICF
jgi:hypothetical protein